MENHVNLSNADKALVLNQALPYIQKYFGKIIVVKYGGNAMGGPELEQAVMSDIVLLTAVGVKVVLVHGGGPELTEMLKRVGKETKFIDGLRYTDRETAEMAEMVLAGKVNKDLAALLNRLGGRAVGLCGIDGGMIQARKKISEPDLGYVGEIEAIQTDILTDALEKGYIPVVASVACGADGELYNINSDTAAAAIASQLHAENLILLTGARGLLRDSADPESLIPDVRVSQVPSLIRDGVISGGMIPKIECCVEAVRRGVSRVFIIDGRIPHSILIEMFSDEGVGTMFH